MRSYLGTVMRPVMTINIHSFTDEIGTSGPTLKHFFVFAKNVQPGSQIGFGAAVLHGVVDGHEGHVEAETPGNLQMNGLSEEPAAVFQSPVVGLNIIRFASAG